MSRAAGGLSLALLAPLALMMGCENTTGPDRTAVAGVYAASTFATVRNGITTDQLAAGAALDITLANDGSTTGQLLVPGANPDGSDFVASMAGTWTLSGSNVTFQQPADTFIPAMTFLFEADTLRGDEIFDDTRILVTLTKQP